MPAAASSSPRRLPLFSPPRPLDASPVRDPNSIPLAPSTPAPQRARLDNLEQQIEKLIAQRHQMERKHRGELAAVKRDLADAVGEKEDWKVKAHEGSGKAGALERCKREGEEMRQDLLDAQDLIEKQARLVLLEEQLVAERLREELRQAEEGTVMRNHKLSRFLSNEKALQREIRSLTHSRDVLAADLKTLDSNYRAQETAFQKALRVQATLSSEIEATQTKLSRLDRKGSDEHSKLATELAEAERKISSLHSIKDDLTLKAESQTEQIDKLKSKVARLSSASEDAEKKWLKTEKQWLKREQDWTEREQGYEQQIEELGAELERSRNKERKTRERFTSDKDGVVSSLRADLKEREDEVLQQVEETRKAISRIRDQERDIHNFKKTIAILKADRHSATTVEPNFSPPPCSPGPAAAFPKKSKPSTTTAPKASSSKPPPLSKAKRSKPREPTPEEDEEAEDFSEQLRGVASKSGGFDSDDDNEDEEETAAAARATVTAKSKGKGKARAILGETEREQDAVDDTSSLKPKPRYNTTVASPEAAEFAEVEEVPLKIKKKKPRTSSDDDEAADPPAKPVKKSKTALSSTTITAAKRKTTAAMDAPLPTAKIKKAAPPEPEADAASVSPVAAEKKKKRKLFGGIKRPDMNFVPEDGGLLGSLAVLSPIKTSTAPLPKRLR